MKESSKKTHKKFWELISIIKFRIINNSEAKPPADIILATKLNNAINTMEKVQREIISLVGTVNANEDCGPPTLLPEDESKTMEGGAKTQSPDQNTIVNPCNTRRN